MAQGFGWGAIAQWLATTTGDGLQWRAPIAVALGAIPGAISRYYLGLACARWFGPGFPVGTLAANLLGATLMGFFITWAGMRGSLSPEVRLLVATGFLGSFTTFSSYVLESVGLGRNANFTIAGVYWLGSAAIGLVCVELGAALARRWL